MAATLARCLVGDVPAPVLRAFLSARLVGIGKATGQGVRVLGCGGVTRRMVGRAAAKELHPLLRDHGGDDQFGLQADGTGKLHRLLQAVGNTRPLVHS